jgi:hypothetical protein
MRSLNIGYASRTVTDFLDELNPYATPGTERYWFGGSKEVRKVEVKHRIQVWG